MEYSAESASRGQRRYWRRRDTAAGWWPWGILPLVGLLALFLYGWLQTAPAIETQTEQSIEQFLQSQGVDVRDIEVDGTRVHIDATAGQYDKEQIRAMAGRAECQTWAGELVCPSTVEVTLDDAAARVTDVDLQPESPESRFHNFKFSRLNDEVTLDGEIADEQTRAELVSQARSHFDRVIDRLTMSGDTTMPQYRSAAMHALEILRHLDSGTASWTAGSFSATGTHSPEQQAALQSLTDGSGLPVGELSFSIVRSATDCNQLLATALQQSGINFRTGSAEIEETSLALLERLAGLAAQCPGTLTIAGHTDDIGDDAMNLALSESRAAAVRDALAELGVVAGRLRARGYGEAQPVADNSTPEGRAKNRRISIQLSENN